MHKEQRVGVFVDVANMYHSAKNLFAARVNFGNVLKEALQDRKLIRALAYVVVSHEETTEEKGFFEALDKQGFEVTMKDLKVFASGSKKGDWDVGITLDVVGMAPKLDTVVLVTGDSDYLPLVDFLHCHGVRVELMAFSQSASGQLVEAVDHFIDLSKDEKKYLMNKGKIKV
ncbi:MAG: NYN domain-containing protein [bacterium]